MGLWAPAPAHLHGRCLLPLQAMQLVPTLGPQLMQLLVQNLPHKLRDRSTQCLYLRGAMALAEGPAGRPVRDGLLLGLVDHLLSIDVEIKWEDIVDVRTGGRRALRGGGVALCWQQAWVVAAVVGARARQFV